jgi:hypothetical protein
MQSFVTMLASLALLMALVGGSWVKAAAADQAVVIPTISIVSVQVDQTVTIRTHNYPANDTFTVLMNYMGTRGVGGIQVGTVDTGSGGSFEKTFNIPNELKGQHRIAIRLQSPTSGYFSFNWFYNNTSGTIPDTGLPPGVIPTFSITSVAPDTSVTISTRNFPANDTFKVLMNVIGTRGVGGYQVDTVNSNAGGTLSWTFNIPNQLKGLRQIAIRLESPTSGYFAYNWFYNVSGGTIPDTGLPPGVIPTFTVTGVVRDTSVTIRTANFPANDEMVVLMNYIGTRGVGGIQVKTIQTGSGGTQNLTFDIPAALKGQNQIAIRLQSSTTGYFAYNWFYNNTYP